MEATILVMESWPPQRTGPEILAATGTLQGQIELYNPQPAINAPASVTEAHAREITAMSMTADCQMLVSASGDGELKFWRVHNERLELLFEMNSVKTPVVQMNFSDDGQYLYLLRKGERDVRRIDWNQMESLFSSSRIGWR